MANNISEARKQELLQLREKISVEFLNIDNKYSLVSLPVNMNFPESLGLQKRVYTPLSESELERLSEEEVAAKYREKLRVLEYNYAQANGRIDYSASLLLQRKNEKINSIDAECLEKVNKLNNRFDDRGLADSFLKDNRIDSEKQKYKMKADDAENNYLEKRKALDDKKNLLATAYAKNKTDLGAQKAAEKTQVRNELIEKDAKLKAEVEKFNATVDEKEAKFQASCRRYERYAQQAEDQRALEAARLFAEVGQASFVSRIRQEKLSKSRTLLMSCTKSEATYIVNYDTMFQSQLGEFYPNLLDWINTLVDA